MVAMLLLGGNSAEGARINLLLEGVSLVVLLATILFSGRFGRPESTKALAVFLAGLSLLYVVQLVPLPPQLWSALPGRELITRGYALLDVSLPWRPLTFSVDRTIASATALLPGLCALSLVLRMPMRHVGTLGVGVITISVLSVLVGIAQVVGGEGSGLYWHNPRATGAAHGFFANPNHLSTLLLVTIPLLVALTLTTIAQHPARQKSLSMILGGAALLLLFGVLSSGSTGGLTLLLPTLLASGVMLMRHPRLRGISGRRAIMVSLAVLAAVSVPFMLVLFRHQTFSWGSSLGFGELERLGIGRTAMAAAVQYFPLGSGLGTFPLVYPAHESLSNVSNIFINHAHNDYLELLFESGIMGAALIVAMFAWWARRTMTAWSARDDLAPWAQASSIAIAIIAVHSGFDYPARTPAILALGAVFCALLERARTLARKVTPARTTH